MRLFPRATIVALAITSIFLCSPRAGRGASVANQLTATEKQELQREARFIVDLLQNHHYSGRAFREMESKAMIDKFLDALDPKSDLLPAADREALHRRFDRTLKPVYLYRGDLQPAFEIFDRFAERAAQRTAWIRERLARGFDFEADETYRETDGPPPKDPIEADRLWELRLKEHVLRERLRGRTKEEAVAKVTKDYERHARTVTAYDPLAVREAFLDAIIRSYDPHSGYFSAESSREFAIQMEKAVVGLGIELRKEEGRCVVSSIQSGGPADLNAPIRPGDTIEALAEGDGPWKSLEGLRLREIVQLIRGPEGTKLRVAYRPEGQDQREEITLERSRIVLGDDRARGSIAEVRDERGQVRRIGTIALPSFYSSGENGRVTSASRDVREILEQMGVDSLAGVVMDLRRNPGGALNEAVALSELFVARGAVMLSRGLDGTIRSHDLAGQPPLYRGPLVVLVDQGSASASEVFAHAMKFHRRAVIVGAPATFGKGTVQAYIDLAQQAGTGTSQWGTLRVTTQRFYGPDGESVQRRGLATDIAFIPNPEDPDERREASMPGALSEDRLPAAQVPAGVTADPVAVSTELVAQLRQVAEQNQAQLPEWSLVQRERAEWTALTKQTEFSLQFEVRERKQEEARARARQLRRDRRQLAPAARYVVHPFEIKVVREEFSRESARLLGATTTGGGFANGALLVTLDSGRLKRLHLDDIAYGWHALDAEEIAARLAARGQPSPTAPAVETFLSQADLLEHKSEAGLRRVGAALAIDDVGRLLTAALEVDGEKLRERASFDVYLRESQRIAARWADILAISSP